MRYYHTLIVQDLFSCWFRSNPAKRRDASTAAIPSTKLGIIFTDSPEIIRACEDLVWNHGTSTPHRSETNGGVARTVRRVNEGTASVWVSKRDSGTMQWHATASCGSVADGQTVRQHRFNALFSGPMIPFGREINY